MLKSFHLWKLQRQLKKKLRKSPELFLRDVNSYIEKSIPNEETHPSLEQLRELVIYLRKEGFFYDPQKENSLFSFYQYLDFLPKFQTQSIFSTPPSLRLDFSAWPTLVVSYCLDSSSFNHQEKLEHQRILHPSTWFSDIQEAQELYWTLRKKASFLAQEKKLTEFLNLSEKPSSKSSKT